jgi:hypothetical protein
MTEPSEPTKPDQPGSTGSSRPTRMEDKLYRIGDKQYRIVEATPEDLREMQLTPEEAVKPEPVRSPVSHHDHGDDHDHDFDDHHDHDHPDEVIEL